MSTARILRWIVLLIALIASVFWSRYAIKHLLGSSITEHDRLAQYSATSQPAQVALDQTEKSQLQWGRQSLFSVACSFFLLLAVLMNWVLDGLKMRTGQE